MAEIAFPPIIPVSCGHLVCGNCMLQIINRERTFICPLCRNEAISYVVPQTMQSHALTSVSEDAKEKAKIVLTQLADKKSLFSLDRQRNTDEKHLYYVKKEACCSCMKNVMLCFLAVLMLMSDYMVITFSFEEFNCFYNQRKIEQEKARLVHPPFGYYSESAADNPYLTVMYETYDRAKRIQYANPSKLAMSDTILYNARLLPSCVQGKDLPKK